MAAGADVTQNPMALPKANGAPTTRLAIMTSREVSADNACTDGPYRHRCPLTLQPARGAKMTTPSNARQATARLFFNQISD